MAEPAELALQTTPIRKRKSDTREEKLQIVRYYYENGKNLYQTCKKFSQNTRTIQRWLQAEKIHHTKKGSMHVKFEWRAQHPEMERLHREYKELRKKGVKVKGWWFRLRARQILSELQPEANFCYSDTWFAGFKRYRLSMRPADKCSAIQHFHCSI